MNGRLEGRLGRWLRGGALVLMCTLAMWIVCAIALYIYAGEGRDPRRYDLVIHKGTDELVAAGQNPLALPSHWNLRSGDVLVLDNREDSQQTFGAWSVGPGELREVVLRPFTGLVQCTLHPEGELVLDVAPVSTDWKLGLLATMAFGPALGLGAVGVARLTGALQNHEEGTRRETWPPPSANRPLLVLTGILAVAATATTLVLMHPWDSSKDATLDGFVENPIRDVSTQSLPDSATGADLPFVARRGGLMLVFFGYTSCPDVCPTTMSDLAKALRSLDPAMAGHVEVAMVTVDPERDSAAQMTTYVTHFGVGWRGLRTDDRNRLDAVVDAFGATYQYGATAIDGSYEVAHSAFVYGVDDTGHVVVEWPSGMSPDKVSRDLALLLGAADQADQ